MQYGAAVIAGWAEEPWACAAIVAPRPHDRHEIVKIGMDKTRAIADDGYRDGHRGILPHGSLDGE
jgi:hypothetical protein